MIVLGWILFAVTIFVLIVSADQLLLCALRRDVRLQSEAEKRSVEDLKFIIDKQIEWRAEKRNYQQRINDLVFQLAKVRKAIDEGNKSDSRERECVNRCRVVRHFTRQGLRRADMTPQWFEESKNKFGEIHEPFLIANPESIDWNDIVRKSSLVISILRDEETGIEEVTETYSYDVDT